MTMTHIDKLAAENLEKAREAGQRALRSHQEEPYDYTNFFSVVEEALNVGLPFVRAQVNQVLTTPRAPFNSQVLKMIKGLTASDLENNGGAFQLAAEVNRLITLFLPTLRVQDIRVVRNGGQLESDAPFQLVINFFDTRSNMADKVTYDLRLKDERDPPRIVQDEETVEHPLVTRVRTIMEDVTDLRWIIEMLPENCKTATILKVIRLDIDKILASELPAVVLHGFSITYNGAPHTRILNLNLSRDNGPLFEVAVQVANMTKNRSKDEDAQIPLNEQYTSQVICDMLVQQMDAVDGTLRTLINNVSENSYYQAEQQPLADELMRLFKVSFPNIRLIEFNVVHGPTRSLRVVYENHNTGKTNTVQVSLPELPKDVKPGLSAFLNKEDALQELANFGQTYQPEFYEKADVPDFKSDDPFFFKGKLIRDNIPTEDCDSDVETDPVRVRYFLLRKLFEELGEAQASNFTDAKEIGDVIDVMYALGKVNHLSKEDIDEARIDKFMTKGGFSGKVWIDPALG